jgi:hypothetical protein
MLADEASEAVCSQRESREHDMVVPHAESEPLLSSRFDIRSTFWLNAVVFHAYEQKQQSKTNCGCPRQNQV